jgi:hypothetical protein
MPARRPPSLTRARRRGAAYVEFLLAFVPILLLFLGMVQLGLLYGGNLVVQHAAHRAVRTGVVVLDDDPRYYGGEPRLIIDGSHATVSDLEWLLVHREAHRTGRSLSRRSTIELAALGIVASIEPRDGDSVADALGALEVGPRSASVHANTDVEIRIHPGPGGSDAPPILRVRVVHGFACRVPVVRGWICREGRRPIEAIDSGAIHVGDMLYGEGDWGAE